MEDDGTEEMPLKQAILYVQNHLAGEGRAVGRYLGLSDPDIQHIHSDYSGNAKEINYQMLRKWQEMKGKNATVSILEDALRNAKRNDIADKLAKGKRQAKFSSKTQVDSSVVKSDMQTPSDAEQRKSNKLLKPVVFLVVVPTLAYIVYLVTVNISMNDENHGVNKRKHYDDDTQKLGDELMEPDQFEIAIIDVKNTLTKEWQDVGRFLGLSHADIQHIKDENDNDPKERNYQMLQKWREQQGKHATLEVLEKALRKVGRRDLADNLVKEIQKEKTRR